MLEKSKELFSKWNNSNIQYCHWKSNEHLDEGLEGNTDLDLFVLPKDEKRAENILEQCNYLRCKVQKENEYRNVCEWIGFDFESGKLIHVHLHYEIITGTKFCKEYVFPINDLIISTRVLDEATNVYITNPNLEIIILFCRIALKATNKSVIELSEEDKREIRYLKERVSWVDVKENCILLLSDNAEAIYQLIKKESLTNIEWNKVYLLALKWLKPHRKYSHIHVYFRFKYFAIHRKIVSVLNNRFKNNIIDQKTLPARAFEICFIGQDGSGKSTVSKEICKWLNWKLSARCFYLGSGDEFYNPWRRRLLKRLNKTDIRIFKPIRYWLYFSDLLGTARYVYRTTVNAKKYVEKGGFAIFDRFPQTVFQGINDGPKIQSTLFDKVPKGFLWLAKWYATKEEYYLKKAEANSPGLVFKLLLTPEESIKRKPFEDIEAIKVKHEIIKSLKFDSSQVISVDAMRPYKEEVLEIKRVIWTKLQG